MSSGPVLEAWDCREHGTRQPALTDCPECAAKDDAINAALPRVVGLTRTAEQVAKDNAMLRFSLGLDPYAPYAPYEGGE